VIVFSLAIIYVKKTGIMCRRFFLGRYLCPIFLQ